MNKSKAIFIFSTLSLAAALATLTGCEEKKAPAQSFTAPVAVVTVRAMDIPANLNYVARTESSRRVEIYSRVNGFLDRRLYTEGGMVREGDILFTIDSKPFEVQLDQAEASLESSKAAHLVAKQNLERIRPLAKIKALSQTDLDSAVGQFNTTEAAVSSAEAQVESAKLNLSYTKIHSPVTGLAGSALQTDGTYINSSNSHLATIYTMSPMWVIFSISENEYQKLTKEVQEGRLALPKDLKFITDIQIGSGDILPQKGHITFASPNYNPNTGTFELRASVENPKGILKPQQYVRAILKGSYYKNAIAVPQVAVQQGAQSHYVWVITPNGTAEFRPVTVGEWAGDNWIITSGLHDGDKVVTEGILLLGNGAPVKVIKDIDQKSLAEEIKKGEEIQSEKTSVKDLESALDDVAPKGDNASAENPTPDSVVADSGSTPGLNTDDDSQANPSAAASSSSK